MQENLTSREREIFNLLLDGISPKEIAHKLHVSSKAVDYHRGNLYGKLGVQSIQELLAKYSNDRQKADPANSVGIEPQTAPTVNKPLKSKRLWLLISVGALVLAVLIFLTWLLLIKPKTSLVSAENPLVFTLYDNEPHGWMYRFTSPSFSKTRITEGDMYVITYSFTSDVDFDLFRIYFVDTTVEADGFYTLLSPHIRGIQKVKANIEYSGMFAININKTASSTSADANQITLDALFYKPDQPPPTLAFTKFEIEKASSSPDGKSSPVNFLNIFNFFNSKVSINVPSTNTLSTARAAENPLSIETTSVETSPTTRPAQSSFSLTFGPNPSYGWFNRIYPPSFRNTRITEGDIYTVSCSFTSDVDFDWFQVLLYDDGESVYEPLSPTVTIVQNVKANVEYSGTVTLIAYQTAKDTSPRSNMIHMDAIISTPDQQPTLTFTKFEVVKVNNLPVSRPPDLLASAANPLVFTLYDNDSKEHHGWFCKFVPPLLYNTRISTGDIYTLMYTFTSNVDLDLFHVSFIDTTKEAGFYTRLSPFINEVQRIKAHTEYKGIFTITADKTSSSTEQSANMIGLEAYDYKPNVSPTLSFTRFELVKTN
jgi:DNA-binding CsgD family transcriptional regulator